MAVYDVTAYGATGNGTTDDAPAIQTAMDLASGTNPGSTLLFPPGTYLVNSELEIKGPVWIQASPAATIKRGSSAMEYILKNFDVTYGPTLYGGRGSIFVEGGIWDGGAPAITTSCTGIIFAHADNVRVRNVTVQNITNWHAIEVNSSRNVRIEDCTLQGRYITDTSTTADQAIQIDLAMAGGAIPGIGAGGLDNTPCNDVVVKGCTVRGLGTLGSWGQLCGSHSAMDGYPHNNVRIIGCYAENLDDFGVEAFNWNNVVISDNTFVNCNGGVLWEIPSNCSHDVERVIISGNQFIGSGTRNNASAVLTNCVETRLSGSGVLRSFIVTGNQIKNYANVNAVSVTATSDVNITDNLIRGGTNSASVGVLASNSACGVYSGNKLDTITAYGFRLTNNSGDCTVNGNSVAIYGTPVSVESPRVVVSGNMLNVSGTGSNGVKVTSAGADSLIAGNIVREMSGGPSVAGIEVTSTINALTIQGNLIKGWGTVEGPAGPVHRGGTVTPNISTAGNASTNTNTYA